MKHFIFIMSLIILIVLCLCGMAMVGGEYISYIDNSLRFGSIIVIIFVCFIIYEQFKHK